MKTHSLSKRVLALALSVLMLLSVMPTMAFAANTDEARNGSKLQVGKTYSVPVQRLDRFGLPIDWGIQDNAIMEYGKDAVAHNALVTPKADGTYDVTLEWAMYNILDAVQFFKQDVITATDATKAMETVKATAMGTFNMPERFYTDFAKSSSNRHKVCDFTDLMHTFFSAEENAKYYDNVKVQNNEAKNVSYITLNLASVEKNVYFKALETWKYGKFTATTGYKPNNEANREAILQRCGECITNGGYSFDVKNAVPVVALSEYGEDTTNVVIERAVEALNLDLLVESKDETIAKVEGLFNGQPEIIKNSDGTVALTYTLADPSKVTSVSVATGRAAYPDNSTNIAVHQTDAMNHLTRAYRAMEYAPVEVKDGKFTVTFKNADEATWGHIVKITNAEGKTDELSGQVVDTNYLFTLKLNYAGVMFSSNEWSFATTKANVNPAAVFEANKLTEGEDYNNIQKKLNGFSTQNLIWNVSLKNGVENAEPKTDVEVNISIPNGWDAENLQLYYLNGAPKDGALVEIKTAKVVDNKLVYSTNNLNRTFVLSQRSVESDIKNLEDGLYSVDIASWNVTQVGEPSMSNAALKRNSSFIEVKDGKYTLYFGLQVITVGKDDGYTQKIFYTNDQGKLTEAEYLGWMTNTAGNSVYNIDYYGEKYGLYYPSVVKVPMAKANIIRNNHEFDFWVPIMDEISGAVPGSGDAHRVAKFKFYNIEKLDPSVSAPTYEPSFLLKALEDAEKIIKNAKPSDYDDETLNHLKNMAESGRKVYTDMLNNADGMKILETTNAINKAIADLKVPVEKADTKVLEEKLKVAKEESQNTKYTDDSLSVLNKAIEVAEKVLKNEKATQLEVDSAANALERAIKGLKTKGDENLNKDKLADGKYLLFAEMFKTNRTDLSMANNAINHNVWLEVKNGEYFLTIQLKGMAIYEKFGYLMNLSYFDAGFKFENGVPTGKLIPAEVLDVQKDENGNVIVDQYNSADKLYPSMLRIKLVEKASGEFVPLQVFVPIMEAITPSTGVQPVLMKLDWTTLKNDDGSVKPEKPEIAHPAVDLEDEVTGLKIHADKNVFKEDVKLVVDPIVKGEKGFDAYEKALADKGSKFQIFDLYFVNEAGEKVQPNGKVSVSYKIPADFDAAKLALYRMNDDGTMTKIAGTSADGYYTVTQKHFSVYALVDTSAVNPVEPETTEPSVPDATKPAHPQTPQTGDSVNLFALVSVMLVSVAAIVVLVLGRKRKTVR